MNAFADTEKTKPIRPNSKPNQTQFEAKTNPILESHMDDIPHQIGFLYRTFGAGQTQFQLFAGDVIRRKLLFLTVYNGKCQFNYVERFQKHPDNQAKLIR